jgi:predicted PurR-regulated permease PerM
MKVDIYNNSLLASLAYVIIIIAGLKAASSIIVPLLMGFFWFLLFLPLINKLRSLGMPDLITNIIVFGTTLLIVLVVGTFLITSGQDLVANLPIYQEKYHELIPKITGFFERFGISLEKKHIIDFFDPMNIIDYTARFLKSMGDIMTNGIMTLIIVMFLFLESSMLRKKMFFLLQTEESKKDVMSFIKNINTYFSIKTLTSALTGFIIYAILVFLSLSMLRYLDLLLFY